MESTGRGGRKCARFRRSKEKVKEVEIESIRKTLASFLNHQPHRSRCPRCPPPPISRSTLRPPLTFRSFLALTAAPAPPRPSLPPPYPRGHNKASMQIGAPPLPEVFVRGELVVVGVRGIFIPDVVVVVREIFIRETISRRARVGRAPW